MAKKALARVAELVGVNFEHAEDSVPSVFREREPSEEWLFHGKDEVGREGWFLRLEATGMYTRRCGPFNTREEAVEALEGFACDVDEAFIEVMNRLRTPGQCSIVEGVPQLVAFTQVR